MVGVVLCCDEANVGVWCCLDDVDLLDDAVTVWLSLFLDFPDDGGGGGGGFTGVTVVLRRDFLDDVEWR